MSLSQALSISLSGLRATQSGLVARRRQRGERADARLRPQVAVAGNHLRRRYRRRRPGRRDQPRARRVSCSASFAWKPPAAPTRRLRASFYQRLQQVYGAARLRQLVRNDVQQLHQRGAAAWRLAGIDGRAQHRAELRPGAGAVLQRHDRPTSRRCAAMPRTVSPTRSRTPTPRCRRSRTINAPARARAAGRRRDRRAEGSARRLRRPAFAVDGHPGRAPATRTSTTCSPIPASSWSARRPPS